MCKRSRDLGASLTLLLLAAGCGERTAPPPGAVGTFAPEYAAPTLTGDTLALTDLQGEAVVLNVWVTWCPPCREEMPSLQQLQDSYAADGLHVVGVSIDRRSAAGEVRSFIDDNALSFTILHDAEERITRTFRTVGVPETILLDREGRVVKRWIGMIDAMDESVQSAVRAALGLEGAS
jgi:peroxiredoxin